jgi:hypothetical protein
MPKPQYALIAAGDGIVTIDTCTAVAAAGVEQTP